MNSFCSYYNQDQCRSCSWIEQDYPTQITLKERRLRQELQFMLPFDLENSVTSKQNRFRNRIKLAVTGTLEAPVIGLHGKTDLDNGRELLACPIHHPKLNELMAALPAFIQKYRLIPYRIGDRQGELKGLIAYRAEGSEEMYLRFVLRSRECVSRLRKMLPELQQSFPKLVCVSANLQPIAHAILEGPEEIILTERKTLEHRIGETRLKLAPNAFVQTNAGVAAQLYQNAATWIAEAAPAKALELYCGQGAFGFVAAKSAGTWLGIEINPEAVQTANQTARELGLSHLNFKCLDATKIEEEMIRFSPDLVLANPPRRGLGEGARQILKQLPRDFLYSSCAVETLAMDIEVLKDAYFLKRVQLFDIFPHTEHFETLVWLQKKPVVGSVA